MHCPHHQLIHSLNHIKSHCQSARAPAWVGLGGVYTVVRHLVHLVTVASLNAAFAINLFVVLTANNAKYVLFQTVLASKSRIFARKWIVRHRA